MTFFFFFQAEDGIRYRNVTGVQTCALPITPEKEQPSPKPQSPPPPKIVLPEEEPEELPVEIGDETYTPEQIKMILTHMLNTIPLGEVKVPILGTYQNCSAGTDIVD